MKDKENKILKSEKNMEENSPMNPVFVRRRQIMHFFTDNIIAFLLVILVIFVGMTRDNFFTWPIL